MNYEIVILSVLRDIKKMLKNQERANAIIISKLSNIERKAKQKHEISEN